MSQSNNHELKDLIGKRITALEINPDSTWLRFSFDGGNLCVYTDGDCCSSAWFEEVLNPDFIVSHTVNDVRDLEDGSLPEYGPSGRQEEDKTYGVQIVTEAGHASLIYRNSSNGYYGSSLDVGDEPKDMEWAPVIAK